MAHIEHASGLTRRGFLWALPAAGLLAACENTLGNNGVGSSNAAQIDARVDKTQEYLFSTYPGTQDLVNQARGVLYMPLVTEAGFFVGAAYGRGALRINGVTVDYYSTTSATFGFQIGAQQYAHALFFMTDDALENFRRSAGWAAGADIRYATPDQGASIGKATTELDPVVALVFGQQGLIAGATLAGTKYTRIIP
jgi:lipid-binding SYLF domain-containing protein